MPSSVAVIGLLALALTAAVCHAGAPPGPETVFNDAGYISVKRDGGEANLFYWVFESRNDPTTDPLVLWMTGGPGCSGLLALFGENGPYIVQEDLSLELNPLSWNNNATVVWVDQPVGTGFSYGGPPVVNENGMAEDMWGFLQGFLQKFSRYAHLPFFIFGESYAGHYVPALSAYILQQNANGGSPVKVNYIASAVGNGLVDPLVQFRYYTEYIKAYNGTTELRVRKAELDLMEALLPICDGLIAACNAANQTEEKWLLCLNSYVMCAYSQLMPVQFSGVNVYDVRMKCSPDLPLCYNFTLIEDYLNQPSVRAALGVGSRKWSECNRLVDMEMAYAGDWTVDFNDDVAAVLNSGRRFLIYAGEYDFICNWMGNQAWTNSLEWKGAEAFAKASNQTWVVGGTKAGTFKTANGFTFVKVNNAGHMVPRDQPLNSLVMLNAFLEDRPLVSDDLENYSDDSEY